MIIKITNIQKLILIYPGFHVSIMKKEQVTRSPQYKEQYKKTQIPKKQRLHEVCPID